MVRCALTAVVLCSALAAGCSDRPKLAKVKGTVTLDGKPLPYGTVTFEAKGYRSATGKIVNGEITNVTTYDPGDGAPVASHRVAVTANAEPGPAVVANPGEGKAPKADYMSGKSLIPSGYNDPTTSGLTADIVAGENSVEFKLSSAGPKK
ncbi:hypothetical protein R5W24_002430 [Gemmata sp. JC717]|uniref:hypothetical protein n=1 Tax=Gemmata algarum TaxID=2975278 RepID=UPI0021BB75E4|nr:hypothetical protein [Gemmata algarum]MDY3553329.1 hypothetical protein [Gemmata algarum]